MQELILLKLGELVLKGLNRHVFEERLCANIRRRIKHCGKFQITSKQSTIYIEPLNEEADLDAAFEACKCIFGIVEATEESLMKRQTCPKNSGQYDRIVGKIDMSRSQRCFYFFGDRGEAGKWKSI